MPNRAVLLLAISLAGCDDTEFPPPRVEYPATWEGVHTFIYDSCRECHFNEYIELPEALLENAAYNTVCESDMCDHELPQVCDDAGVTCEQCGADQCLLVVPNDPDRSLLWRVLSEADRIPGDLPMPPTGDLPPDQVAFVRDWILAGAPQ